VLLSRSLNEERVSESSPHVSARLRHSSRRRPNRNVAAVAEGPPALVKDLWMPSVEEDMADMGVSAPSLMDRGTDIIAAPPSTSNGRFSGNK